MPRSADRRIDQFLLRAFEPVVQFLIKFARQTNRAVNESRLSVFANHTVIAMTIGAISLFSYAPLGRSLLGASARASPGGADAEGVDRLVRALSSRLQAVDPQQDAISRVTTQLMQLRDALKASRDQGAMAGSRPDLRAIITDLEQTITKTTAHRQDVYETQPVYQQQDVHATIVTGTQTLTGFSSTAAAGIHNGDDFSVQVGSDALASIEFRTSTRIRVTINGGHTDFNFTSNNGSWQTALVDALNSVANLSASITAGGKLELQTANAESLAIADVAGGGSALSELGLTAGTTQSSVVGTEQTQVGTQEVQVGTELVEGGTIQISQGTQSVVVGYDKIQASAPDPTSTAAVRDSLQGLVSAVGALMAATGGTAPSPAPGLSADARAFAASLSELLQSPDFDGLGDVSRADAFDRVIGKLDEALSRAKMIGERIANSPDRNAGLLFQANLNAALLSSAQTFAADASGLAKQSAEAFRRPSSFLSNGHRMSIWS
jgi:hypothetical protein